MEAIENLLTRNSHANLVEPAPTGDALQCILQAGLRAPDHARLRPWHFVVIAGERREALGDLFAASKRQAITTDDDDPAVKKARHSPLRAPLIIAGLLRGQEHPKVPRIEQAVAVGCALHGMSLAAEALGFGAMWRTGDVARDPAVVSALGGAAGDEVVGFLYLGTKAGTEKPLPDELIDDFVTYF